MKDDSMTPEDVSTPPPLTPKDSLSVEIRELREMIKDGSHWMSQRSSHTIHRLFAIVDELMKKDQKCNNSVIEAMLRFPNVGEYADQKEKELATTQAQLRRKDEALQFYADIRSWQPIALPGNRKTEVWITDLIKQDEGRVARAALADGKEV